MRFKVTITTWLMILAMIMPGLFAVPQKAEAQLGGLLGSVLGGGEPVRIVSDVAPTTITNTLKTALIELRTALTGISIDSLNLKETVLDPIAWNMAKQLQQQLTGNLLKWLGGQLPGQNGQVPFIQDYSEYWGDLFDEVTGQLLSDNTLTGLCSEEEDFQIKVRVYETYVATRSDDEPIFQCSDDTNDAASTTHRSAVDKLLAKSIECSDVTCAAYYAEYKQALAVANSFANEDKLTDLTKGMIPQRVCREEQIPLPNGGTTTSRPCELVSPAFITPDTVSFNLTQLPGLQLLQMDEFNEIVSNLMSNLTNQAVTGLTGVLGLSGNPTYSRNVFGEGGNLSYVDALIADDIASYQTVTGNPIREALDAEKDYQTMLKKIAAEIKIIDDKLAADTAEFAGCFDLELTPELEEAKASNITGLAIASTSIAILTTLDAQYASSTSASAKGAVMSTFISYKNQGLFRTDYDNQQFKITYLDYTFAEMADKFRYDIAVERQSCGGEFDYEGVLNPPDDA